jgi:hypothetical protein
MHPGAAQEMFSHQNNHIRLIKNSFEKFGSNAKGDHRQKSRSRLSTGGGPQEIFKKFRVRMFRRLVSGRFAPKMFLSPPSPFAPLTN